MNWFKRGGLIILLIILLDYYFCQKNYFRKLFQKIDFGCSKLGFMAKFIEWVCVKFFFFQQKKRWTMIGFAF